MFILELTLRSWIHAEENKRRTLQRNDIAAAITKTDIFDFLVSHQPHCLPSPALHHAPSLPPLPCTQPRPPHCLPSPALNVAPLAASPPLHSTTPP